MNRVKAIISAEAYLPKDQEIRFILNGCGLNPVDGWRVWQNKTPLYIELSQKKEILIKTKEGSKYDLDDLLAQARPEVIATICKLALIYIDQHELFMLMLCEDKRIRIAKYKNGCWHPPQITLSVGLEMLRMLISHRRITSYRQLSPYIWVTKWPPVQIKELEKYHKELWNQVNSLHQDS